jgi:hypothetical protein
MTKERRPLSVDSALARIAGQVPGSWAQMARTVGYAERTVRKWGDEDADERVNIPAAIALDILFQQHGGSGQPIYEAYGYLIKASVAASFADQFEILRRAVVVATETAQAQSALMRVALPDATDNDRRIAQRELREAIEVLQGCLLSLEHFLIVPEPHSRAPP